MAVDACQATNGTREQVRQAVCLKIGLVDREVPADGQWHTTDIAGDPRGRGDGRIKLFRDGAGGMVKNWKTDEQEIFFYDNGHHFTESERASREQRRVQALREGEEERVRRQAEAASAARRIWDAAEAAPTDHPYLQRKQVGPHGLRLYRGNLPIAGEPVDGALIIPLQDESGTLWSLEFIMPDGTKRFLRDGRKRGCFYLIGEIADCLAIAEGFATAASVREATGLPVAVAFDAGNLQPVAETFRRQYPAAAIRLCSDHDKNGVGQTKSKEAAVAVGGLVAIPEKEGMDFNDLHVQQGLEAVRRSLQAAFEPHQQVLDEIHAFLGRFVAYPSEHARIAHTLWIAHTHLMDHWESTPRLAFLSPEPGSGKTRALELTATLVPRPVESINATPAYLFRKVSDPDGLPTILYDEIDTLFGPRAKEHEEIRGLINAGHRKGAMAGRCIMKGKTVETQDFPAFCPVALAGLGNLPDTILTRSVVIKMRRRAPGEIVQPYRRRLHAPEGNKIRNQLAAWAREHAGTLNTDPPMPDGITDRNADVWEALLSVADAAGGDWPEMARNAAVALVADAKGDKGSLGVRLLTDIRAAFSGKPSMSTSDVLATLNVMEEAPWGDLKGKPLDARRLANYLKPYGVSSRDVRIAGSTVKGYTAEDLYDAWQRYLPPNPVPSVPIVSATCATSAAENTEDPICLFEEDH